MKIFVSGRMHDIETVKNIYKILKENGHQITMDWTLHGNIKPYSENSDKAKQFAVDDMKGIEQCDVFIFVTHPEVAGGSSAELGAAILSNITRGFPKIYMVGEYNQSVVFYYHPSVHKRKTIQDVIKELE